MPPRTLAPLAVAALALLAERAMHPYEMYQLLIKRHEDKVVKLSAGTLYRAIERLDADGLIVAEGTEREGNRPERTLYAITAAGHDALRARIAAMLGEHVNEFPQFSLAIGEAHNLPRAEVIDLLTARLRSLDEVVSYIDAHLPGPLEESGVERRWILNVDYTRTMLLAEAAWVRATRDQISSGDIPWRTDGDLLAGREK